MLAQRRFCMDILLCMDILKNSYVQASLSENSETLRTSLAEGGLNVGKVSGLNSKLRFYRKSRVI